MTVVLLRFCAGLRRGLEWIWEAVSFLERSDCFGGVMHCLTLLIGLGPELLRGADAAGFLFWRQFYLPFSLAGGLRCRMA
jgi:hypothetical protein